MRKLLKWSLIVLIWLVIIAALLEAGLRVLADRLPGQLAIGAHYALTGERYQEDQAVSTMTTDIDNGYVMLPNLTNVTETVSPGVTFQISTIPLWGSRFGFRTPPIDYLVEMAAVGDSFTFCFTNYEDCWVRRFEVETGLGSVDLGQPGTASQSHLSILKTFVAPLKPRLVLWQFFGNDFYEDYWLAVQRGEIHDSSSTAGLKPPTSPPDNSLGGWLRRHSVAFAVSEVAMGNLWPYLSDYQRLFEGHYTVEFGGQTMKFGQTYERLVMDLSDPHNAEGEQFTRDALTQAQDLVSGWDGHLGVILIPTREQVYSFLTAPLMGEDALKVYDEPRQVMLQMCQDLNLLCFDPLPQLQQHAQAGEILYYPDDMHMNPRGNEVLAQLVLGWLGGYHLLYADN